VFWFLPSILVFTRYSGLHQVFRFSPGILVFTRYSGLHRVFWLSPGNLVFTRYSGFLQVLWSSRVFWFSPGILVFSRYSSFHYAFWFSLRNHGHDITDAISCGRTNWNRTIIPYNFFSEFDAGFWIWCYYNLCKICNNK
jgi:hypothetical protein